MTDIPHDVTTNDTTLTLTFERPTPDIVSEARTAIRTTLRETNPSFDIEDAALLISELLTNALRHAAPPYSVRATVSSESLRIEVDDASPELIPPRQAMPKGLSGHGLVIVAGLCSAWPLGFSRRLEFRPQAVWAHEAA